MRMSRLIAVGLALAAMAVSSALAQNAPPRMGASQVTVAATATLTAIARSNRMAVTIQNHGTTAMYCGPDSTVTSSTGFRLPGVDGASVTIPTTAIVYCITGGGTQAVSVLESY
jgi:hypothetical protein